MFYGSLLPQTSYLPAVHGKQQKVPHSPRKSSKTSLLFFPVPKLWISPVLPWLQVGSTDLLFQEKDHPAYTKSLLQILPVARVSSFGKASLLSPLPPEGSRFLRSSVPTSPVFPQSMQALPKSKTTPHIEMDFLSYKKESLQASLPQKSAPLGKAARQIRRQDRRRALL